MGEGNSVSRAAQQCARRRGGARTAYLRQDPIGEVAALSVEKEQALVRRQPLEHSLDSRLRRGLLLPFAPTPCQRTPHSTPDPCSSLRQALPLGRVTEPLPYLFGTTMRSPDEVAATAAMGFEWIARWMLWA